MSEFGTICERKSRVNIGQSKVIRCSRYGNWGRMNVIVNGEPLEEVDCFKYLGSTAVGINCENCATTAESHVAGVKYMGRRSVCLRIVCVSYLT